MKRIHIILFTAATLAGVSCKKDFGDINVNPNISGVASTKFLFGNAIIGLRGTFNAASGMLYPQFMSEFIYTNESRYNQKAYDFNPIYFGPLADLQRMIDMNTNADTKNTKAILDNGTNENQLGHARILKAFYMLHITDRWGDVPYKEALKGNADLQPALDPQRDIYVDLLKELKEAPLQVNAAMPNDALFDGNFTSWARWGNSLRAIAALRLSKTSEAANAKIAFQEAVAAGIMQSNGDNVIFKHLANLNFESPWYTNYVRNGRVDYGVSTTIVDKMVAYADPRLAVYARVVPNTTVYRGVPYGVMQQNNYPDFSLLGRAIYAQNAPLQITTYAQMCFTMAEAALIGWISGGDATVADWYNKGIAASMQYWASISTNPLVAISQAQIDAYAAQAPILISATNANGLTDAQKLERIQTQKWLNFYMNNGFEAWAEWRRTGYPVLSPAPDALSLDKQIPRRQGYPVTESGLNGANYNAAVQRQGPDELATRVWWNK